MERVTRPRNADPVDRLIGGALQEASDLSWDTPGSDDSAVPSLPPDVFPGYQVLKQIRAGGQAVVYLGADETTGERVAIKVFHASGAPTPKERFRFEREVESLQGLCHPCITRILHADPGDAGEGARPYIVMEYVPGWNLDEYFLEHSLSVRETMRLFTKIAAAVCAAHQKGIIHRDIKPSNIRVDHNGEPHVFDFGLAKIEPLRHESSAASAPTMSETGRFLGTLYWVSPEQAEGRRQEVDVRTDVYSLGMVLYHMLTGRLPFETGGSMRDVLNRIATAEPAPPRKYRREIDDDVETIVMKCLAKEPGRRYGTAAEVVEDVERWLSGRPILAKRDSMGYVVRKFARRHWVGCALVLVIIVSITVLSLGYGWIESERAQAKAELARVQAKESRDKGAIAESALAFVEATEWFLELRNNTPKDKSKLQALIRSIDSMPPVNKPAELIMRRRIAGRCSECGFADLALEQGMRLIDTAQRDFGDGSREHVAAMSYYIPCAINAGQTGAALKMSATALDAARKLDRSDGDVLLSALAARWQVCLGEGDLEGAEQSVREGIDVSHAWCGGDPRCLANSIKGLSDQLFGIVRALESRGIEFTPLLNEAIDLQREALGYADVVYATQPGQLAHHIHALGVQLCEAGRLVEAEPFVVEALKLRQAHINRASDSAYYIYVSACSLGVLRFHQGNFEEAEEDLLYAFNGLMMSDAPIFVEQRVECARWVSRVYENWSWDGPDGNMFAIESLRWWQVAKDEAAKLQK